ncbi:hypothetical protein [Sandarakinorhabdus sp.]|uniref:hypothetical protein n=1 Tax=Sandarakinorhabdus sp. TaxID=1916663 RepID=UPI00286DEC04|nr:hypothetical protein [Sandarakinorhabdus sp.]
MADFGKHLLFISSKRRQGKEKFSSNCILALADAAQDARIYLETNRCYTVCIEGFVSIGLNRGARPL